MSKEVESKFPGVIARLMGLDNMPSSHVTPKQQKEMTNFRKRSTKGATKKGYSPLMSSNEHQESTGIFEVFEISKIGKHKNQKSWIETSNGIMNETEAALTEQKFMDVKRFPTDETFHSYNYLNDASESLKNEDLFLKSLHKTDSLFPKHIYDLIYTPPSQDASHITILKPSEGFKHETREACGPVRTVESYTHTQMDEACSYWKSVTSYHSQSFKEHNCYLPSKFSEPQSIRKVEAYHDPGRIVILKPSNGKDSNVAGTIPSARSHECHQFDCRRNVHTTRNHELHLEGKDWQKFSSEYAMEYKTKNSRKPVKEFSKEVRHTASSGSRKARGSKSSWYVMHSCVGSEVTSPSSNQEDQSASSQLYDHSNSFGTSSSYSAKSALNRVSKRELAASSYLTESSVNRKARKWLYKQWKMTQPSQEAELVSIRSSTLGEMFAESDTDMPETADPLKVLYTRPAKDEASAAQGYRCSVRSENGWENRHINLPNPRSYPTSLRDDGYRDPSTGSNVLNGNNFYMLKDPQLDLNGSLIVQSCPSGISSVRTLKYHNMARKFYYAREDNCLHEEEIHVKSEKMRNRTPMNHVSCEKAVIPQTSEYNRVNKAYQIDDHSVPELIKKPVTSAMLEKELIKKPVTLTMLEKGLEKKPVTLKMMEKDGEITCYNQENLAIKEERIHHPQVDRLPAYCNLSEYGSPISSSEAEQSCPVSSMEPPSEEERSSSGCFQKITADLQELRTQLQRLKFNSANEDADNLEVLIQNDQRTGGHHSEILQAFRNEEERDFSYILDVVIESGVHTLDWYMLFNTCYSVEYPVGAYVFEKLETKYSLLVSWPKTERKLLFDLVNDTLVSCIATKMNPQPLMKPSRLLRPILGRESFIEELWQMVVRQRKELTSDLVEKPLEGRWLDLESDVYMVGNEIETMLEEKFLEELVSELILK